MVDKYGKIEIVIGDITALKVDAIVNAANSSLLGGGGVDGAIHRAAGPGLLEECRQAGGCPTGEARLTGGYNLSARFVIHTVGPVYSRSSDDALLLGKCYSSSLAIAAEKKLESIAFPAISCGAYGYPVSEAAPVAIETVAAFLEQSDSIKNVCFVLFSERDASVYRALIFD